jgi:hypothetical protein
MFFIISFQLLFGLLASSVFKTSNLYPFYDWRIYSRYPYKNEELVLLYVSKIDDVDINPALPIQKLRKFFPDIDLHALGAHLYQPEKLTNEREIILLIEEILLRNHQQVRWELRNLKIDIIGFYSAESILESDIIGTYVSKK